MEIVLSEYLLAGLLGLVSVITIIVVNFFSYSLKPKSYDEAISEINKETKNKKKSDPKSPRKKKEKPKKDESNDEENNENEAQAFRPRRVSRQHSRLRRPDSVKNDHVMFADEISMDDEKYSPQAGDSEVEGILQNREEVPMVDLEGEDKVRNSFGEIQPLDDLQLIRRKSLQLTPTSSQGNSKSGSRQDLSNLGLDRLEEDSESDAEPSRRPILKFAEKVEERLLKEEEGEMDVKKVCKILKKLEMADTEISQIIDIMLKKEEQSAWASQKSKSLSTLSQLKKEIEEKQNVADEANDLANSLQAKLKNLRSDFAEEKSALVRERREMEEANAALKQSLKLAEDSKQEMKVKLEEASKSGDKENNDTRELRDKIVVLETELERLKSKVAESKGSDDSSDLRERLKNEMEENARLSTAVKEQQGVITTALRRIFPNMEVGELCPEHQESFDKFVANMKKEKSLD